MTNLVNQPTESHERTPEQDVLELYAHRMNEVAAVRMQLENIDALNDANSAPEVDLSQHFNPSMPVGRLATESMNNNALTMGNVISLAKRQEAIQNQRPAEQSLWSTSTEVPAQPSNMDVEAWENYVNSLARSKGEIDLNDDIKKAA